jgi:hypothetical protein
MNDFARTLQDQLKARNKSLTFLAEFTGIDRAYVSRLARGERERPSPETVVKLWMGLIACEEQFRKDPTMPFGLAELLTSAGLTATARSH